MFFPPLGAQHTMCAGQRCSFSFASVAVASSLTNSRNTYQDWWHCKGEIMEHKTFGMNIVPELHWSIKSVKKKVTVCPVPDIFLPLGHPHHQWQHNDLVWEFLVERWSQRVQCSFKCSCKSITYACACLDCFINVHINCIQKLLSLSGFFLLTWKEQKPSWCMSHYYTLSTSKRQGKRKNILPFFSSGLVSELPINTIVIQVNASFCEDFYVLVFCSFQYSFIRERMKCNSHVKEYVVKHSTNKN